MRVAALDLGTNTFLLLVADIEDGRLTVVHDEVRIVRLGQGVHQARTFQPEALERAEKCFADFSVTAKKLGAKKILACATSAARDVKNGNELIEIAARYDIPVKIISGEKEAEYTFSGTLREPLTSPAVIVDTGGGSTEYILANKEGLVARKSLDIGSVRLTEMFVTQHPIPSSEMEKLTSYIGNQLKTLDRSFFRTKKMIAVAGTPTTLATLDQGLPFETDRVDGYKMSVERIQHWVERLAGMSIEERTKLAGMEPKRADVIVAGSVILLLSARELRINEIEVSTRGLRFGVARELAGGVGN